MTISGTLQENARNRCLIAAHRGAAGANIPCNSIPAYNTALRHGADVIELDISRAKDGALYCYHPGTEPIFLLTDRRIPDMTAKEVDELRLVNQDNTPTEWGIPRFEDVMRELRGKCFINIDKFWTCPQEIAALVRSLGMQDQVLIKTSNKPENFARVEEAAWDIPYMVIARDHDTFTDELLKRRMRYVGVEALFAADDSPIADPAYIERMHECGLIMWANGIIYNYKDVLAANHSDDISVSVDEDLGWGWLLDRGFDIIQTDWPLALDMYLRKRGLR